MQTLQARYRRSSWFVPLFAVALGVVMLVAQWIGGDLSGGVVSLGIMVAFAAVVVVAARFSGTAEIMRRPAADERTRSIDLTATAFAGITVIMVILAAFVYELAQGHDASPYTQLGAVAGIAYLGALIVLQRRS